MLRTAITIIALATAVSVLGETPALAAPIEATLTASDLSQVHYTARLGHGDKIEISGVDLTQSEPIALTVDGSGHVDGYYGSNPVSFTIAREQRDRIVAQLHGDVAEVAAPTVVASLTR